DAKIEPKVKTIGVFPDSSYPPVTYPVAATSSTKKPAVGQYFNFLRSSAARSVFERYGFSYLIKPVS
ncbi:MAG: substrate-binding domain-containing protein, partial [Pseudolabrys sp.]